MDRYEEVVRQMIADGQISQDVIDRYLPELKESEDERIRKAIIETLLPKRGYLPQTNIKVEDAVAWLEKQGVKPKSKTALEAIKEEKADNANKNEHKFKVGDWVVREFENNYKEVGQIINLKFVCDDKTGKLGVIYFVQDIMATISMME